MDKAEFKQALWEILPEFASALMELQQEKRKEEELLTFRQVEKEYKLNYYNLMKLKARGLLIVTYINGHPFLTRKEAQRQQSLKGKHNKSL